MNSNSNLSKKIAMIMAASMSALSVGANTLPAQSVPSEGKTIEYKQVKTAKPMPVLKLNFSNPANSKFVAQHSSHSWNTCPWTRMGGGTLT